MLTEHFVSRRMQGSAEQRAQIEHATSSFCTFTVQYVVEVLRADCDSNSLNDGVSAWSV